MCILYRNSKVKAKQALEVQIHLVMKKIPHNFSQVQSLLVEGEKEWELLGPHMIHLNKVAAGLLGEEGVEALAV